jgi:acyl carrier protein
VTTAELRTLIHTTLQEIAPDVDTATLADDADLQRTLDLDSMDFLNFVIALSDATGVEVPERDYPTMATVGGATAYLLAHAGAVRS